MPKLSFNGFAAWLLWMTLHKLLLIGFKNRLIVFINWIYKYFTHRQSLALLFPLLNPKKISRIVEVKFGLTSQREGLQAAQSKP